MSLEDENHKWVYTYGAGKAEGNRTQKISLEEKELVYMIYDQLEFQFNKDLLLYS